MSQHPPYKGEFESVISLSCRYLFQFVTMNMTKHYNKQRLNNLVNIFGNNPN